MAKYLSLWEMNPSSMPIDPAERSAMLGKLLEMTKKGLAEGGIKDWGIFPGGFAGYGLSEGSGTEALARALTFSPYVKFEVKQVLDINEVAQIMQSMKP